MERPPTLPPQRPPPSPPPSPLAPAVEEGQQLDIEVLYVLFAIVMAGGYNDNNRNSAPRSSISKEGPGRKIERTPSKIGRDLLALAANVAAAEAAAEGAAAEANAEGGTPPGTPPREQAIWTHPQESARMLQQAVARHDEKEAAALSARGGVPDVELTV